MKDRLSYKQLYDELDALNTSVYDSLLHEDFEEFQEIIDEFTNSGIMEQEAFAAAREAYRYSSMPFTLDGIWISVDSHNPLDKPIADFSGWPIQELNKRDIRPVYAYLTEQIDANPEDSRLASERINTLEKYKELYKKLYDGLCHEEGYSASLIDDAQQFKMIYINRVTRLAALRSKFYMTFDFTCLPLNGIKIIDNETLKTKNTSEKIEYLKQSLDSLYNPAKNKNRFKVTDCFSFNGHKKILASNYLQGKNIPRKNWKYYTAGQLPKTPEFYLELAFYLTIPSSAEIEKFMNLHGYSIKRSMLQFGKATIGNHPILYRDLCRWIDAGIDYNLLNNICGFLLEKKEIRKSSRK